MTGQKFLLIREIGAGLWNELHHILTQLVISEAVNRIPVVYWGKRCLYSPDDDVNVFEEFFMPVSEFGAYDLAKKEFSFYPGRWNSGNILAVPPYPENCGDRTPERLLKRDEDVIVADRYIEAENVISFLPERHPLSGLSPEELFYSLISRYIRLRKDIQDAIDDFYNRNMKGSSFLAVHIRSSDKLTEVKHLHELNERYPAEIDKILEANPGIRIFLMTDCTDVLEEYRKRYGDLLVYTDCRRVPKDGPGVHFQKYQDNRVKGFEIIRDSWLAAKCDFFIGNAHSNVSRGVCELKNWENDRVRLLY